MTLKDNVRSLFGTPLAAFRMPQAGEINPTLLSWLKQKEHGQGADTARPLNGWHTELDLDRGARPDVQEIADSMRHAMYNMLGILTGLERFEAQLDLQANASIYRARSHGHLTMHPGTAWSGIYFVEAAKLAQESTGNAGQLSFHDPRTRAGMLDPPGNRYRPTWQLKPSDGLMVVFPSWLQFQVNGFVSDTLVCMLTFKARVRKFRIADRAAMG